MDSSMPYLSKSTEDCGVHHLVERRARQMPEAAAIEYQGRTWTYRQVDRSAENLARQLLSRGIGREELLGIYLDRSPQFIVSMLGTLKAGAAYVPLDPLYPRQRLAYMVADSGIRLVLSRAELAVTLPNSPLDIIAVDDDIPLVTQRPPSSRGLEVRAGDLAYAMYTSGTTGRPKAVRIEHGGICNLARSQADVFGVRPGSRVLQFSSMSFDASTSEVFVTLVAGGTLCLARPNDLVPGPALAKTLRQLRIEVVTLPPFVLAKLGQVQLPDLRTVVVAGEPCPAGMASRWSVGRRLVNAYGPTETTVCATMHICPHGEQPAPPIGKAIPNVRLRIHDRQGRAVEPGQVGELLVGGVGVARDYLNQPKLTREKFLPEPEHPGSKMYCTGDLVRLREDGLLEFVGRLDDQIKIHGVRIEPREISSVLEQNASVAMSVVYPETLADGKMQLVAVTTPVAGHVVKPDTLYEWCKRRLPIHLCPGTIRVLDRLPLLANGKVDLNSLRGRNIAATPADQVSIPARDQTELALTELVGEVLRRPFVDVDADFFRSGGDSLSAFELLAQIESKLAVSVPYATLVQSPTVAGLAAAIRQERSPETWTSLVTLASGGGRSPFYLAAPAGGNVFCYQQLAQHLERERPIVGLQSPGVDGVRPAFDSVEEIAAFHVEQIVRFQPKGRYFLGGWSFGGIVAYEIACQLRERGNEVGLLAILDAGFLYSFGVLRTIFSDQAVPLFHLAAETTDTLLEQMREAGVRAQLIPEMATDQMAQQIANVFGKNVEALWNYRPRHYAGRATLVRAKERFVNVRVRRDPSQEWSELCSKGVEELSTPGDHLTMIQPPHDAALSRRLRRCLRHTRLHPTDSPLRRKTILAARDAVSDS